MTNPSPNEPPKAQVSRFVTEDGLELAYADQGQGKPLLCLNGLTRNMRDFEPVVDRFADRARLVRLDSRGRGESDFDPDFRNYNTLREASDALALLDHLGIGQAAILGTSRGGLIAMTLAAGHRDRLSGVCLIDIGPMIEPKGLDYIFSYLGVAPSFRDYEEAGRQMAISMADRFPGVPASTWRDHAERIWMETPDGLVLRYDPQLRRAAMAQLTPDAMPDLWPLFDAMEGMPLALLHAEHSDILSDETARKMRERRPDMLYAQVPDRGHVPFLDEPQSVSLIAAFLDRLP